MGNQDQYSQPFDESAPSFAEDSYPQQEPVSGVNDREMKYRTAYTGGPQPRNQSVVLDGNRNGLGLMEH